MWCRDSETAGYPKGQAHRGIGNEQRTGQTPQKGAGGVGYREQGSHALSGNLNPNAKTPESWSWLNVTDIN